MSEEYLIEFTAAAQKQFKKLERSLQKRIAGAIDRLATDPRPRLVKKLSGEESLYRIRIGNYRIIYQIKDKKLLILVIRIAHRKDAY